MLLQSITWFLNISQQECIKYLPYRSQVSVNIMDQIITQLVITLLIIIS